ncbi:MAG: 50S ribosomal protein L15 [Candidatus Eisenbacteria bacterium]
MKLNELRPAKGATKGRKRVGRGQGSGWGHTAGKGEKGQKARSGGAPHKWFEGGQMPLIRRVPKMGFHSPNRVEYQVVNLSDLRRFDAGSEVTVATLLEAKLVRKKTAPVKILAKGEIDRALKIKVHAASDAAKAKIEAAGGSVDVLGTGK